jgi:hypothetical protein
MIDLNPCLTNEEHKECFLLLPYGSRMLVGYMWGYPYEFNEEHVKTNVRNSINP